MVRIINVSAKIGSDINKRFFIGFWSIFKKSATIKRAERNAVSPDVIGAAITPNKAKNPPKVPNHLLDIKFTTSDALFAVAGNVATNSCKPPIEPKNDAAAAAQTSATNPSATMAP